MTKEMRRFANVSSDLESVEFEQPKTRIDNKLSIGDNHGSVQNIVGDTVTLNVINDLEKITEAMNIALKRNNK